VKKEGGASSLDILRNTSTHLRTLEGSHEGRARFMAGLLRKDGGR